MSDNDNNERKPGIAERFLAPRDEDKNAIQDWFNSDVGKTILTVALIGVVAWTVLTVVLRVF